MNMSFPRIPLVPALILTALAGGCLSPKEPAVQLQSISGDVSIDSLNGSSVHIRPVSYARKPVTILEWDSSATGSMVFEITVPPDLDVRVAASDGTQEVRLDSGRGNRVTLNHAATRVSFTAKSRTGLPRVKPDNAFTTRANPELPHLTPVPSLPNRKEVIVWADFDGVRSSFRLSETF